jgi:hypothetical protein
MATADMTPPTPGLEHEEPELWSEDDIPTPSNDDPEEAARHTEVHPQKP